MATKFFGKRIKRNEDPRLLTGKALFVDDVLIPGMLHVAYYRSPYGHALIKNIDVSKAKERKNGRASLPSIAHKTWAITGKQVS